MGEISHWNVTELPSSLIYQFNSLSSKNRYSLKGIVLLRFTFQKLCSLLRIHRMCTTSMWCACVSAVWWTSWPSLPEKCMLTKPKAAAWSGKDAPVNHKQWSFTLVQVFSTEAYCINERKNSLQQISWAFPVQVVHFIFLILKLLNTVLFWSTCESSNFWNECLIFLMTREDILKFYANVLKLSHGQ